MHKIDVSKGECISTVSNQWANRSDDQRFTNLTDLRAQVALWESQSVTKDILPQDIRAVYDNLRPDFLGLEIEGEVVEASHWGFDQIARIAEAPASYLRSLPAPLAALNLNYGLAATDQREAAAYLRNVPGEKTTLRGMTSTKYGRIFDREVVDAVMNVAGNGNGDTRWKVPGCIDWGGEYGISYNSEVDITKENTTLYASDRDVFLFLVDDRNPIEVGKLSDGSPDLMFRGFYVWNSEVGCRTFGFSSMYLRGVCQNRNLWGVEGFNEIVFKHTSGAPGRFIEQATPALMTFADGASSRLVAGVQAAKQAIVAKDDEERIDFLAKFGFSQKQGNRVIQQHLIEEGNKPSSVWDFSQGITALARQETLQDARLKLEQVAGKMLDKVKVPA